MTMNDLLLIGSWILFFFLGRWSKSIKRPHTDTIDDIVEKARIITPSQMPKMTIKPGAITYKTPEEFEREKNGDKALADHWEKSGIAKEVMK